MGSTGYYRKMQVSDFYLCWVSRHLFTEELNRHLIHIVQRWYTPVRKDLFLSPQKCHRWKAASIVTHRNKLWFCIHNRECVCSLFWRYSFKKKSSCIFLNYRQENKCVYILSVLTYTVCQNSCLYDVGRVYHTLQRSQGVVTERWRMPLVSCKLPKR